MTFIILQEKLLIEEDFKEVLQQDEKISQIYKRITETKKNLDNLRRSVYMGLIPDKVFFLAEQESPEKEDARLEDERSKVVAIANDWKDVANDAFMIARYAKEDFDSDDWERKRAVIKRLGANLKLSGRTIEFTPVKYLVPVAEESECLKAKKEAARTASQQMKKDLKEDLISSWCAIAHEVGTIIRSDIFDSLGIEGVSGHETRIRLNGKFL